MTGGRRVAVKVVGAIVSLVGVLVFAYGLFAGIALLSNGQRTWFALLPPSLLAIGLALVWTGNRLQGWGLLSRRAPNGR